ncbi:DUF2231 domain-containing protein [Kribbella sp.]|uniref:DUF2231 domain-containing protein n=1 Tax=Kribbella sp. TaxID=1871183 RepID=UPI002D294FE2|nr:DUF2231 domain-containing protein [Kribbella sp.]HZX04644.1 DUF2231 domain-containing protein [Kribbella sp.]
MDANHHETALEQAKRPRSIIAGPYGHPFHPILVTVPIGTWVASIVFDIVALADAAEEKAFSEGAYWLIGIGIVGAVLAAVFGLIDLLAIPRGTRVFRTGLTHMALNLIVVVVFVVDFAVRAGQGYENASTAGLVLSLVALALLGVSGWLGGRLAYHYGVRVASEGTQSEGYR